MKALKAIGIFIVALMLSYLCAAFVSWEFNPGMWSAFARCNTIVAAGALTWASIGLLFGIA